MELDRRHRPQVLAHEDLLPLAAPLAGLLGEPGLRRGSTVAVASRTGLGATTVALGLAAAASAEGAWTAAVDLPGLGVLAAAELGIELARLVLVPDSGRRFASTGAALLDACEVVLVGMPDRFEATTARRLVTRARERRSVLVLCAGAARPATCRGTVPGTSRPLAPAWPDGIDARLEVTAAGWIGLDEGSGRLCARLAELTATRRRRAPMSVQARIWLPGPDGRIAAAEGAAITGSMRRQA